MKNYRKSKQHIEGIQKQKINTETRCANQRKQLALMNIQIKNYKELLKECRTIIYENLLGEYIIELCERLTNALGEKRE